MENSSQSDDSGLFASREAYPFNDYDEAEKYWKVHMDNLRDGINYTFKSSSNKNTLAIIGVGAALDLNIAEILISNNYPEVYLIDISKTKLDQCFKYTSRKIQDYLYNNKITTISLSDIQEKIHLTVLDVSPGMSEFLHCINEIDFHSAEIKNEYCDEDSMNRIFSLIEKSMTVFFENRPLPHHLKDAFDICVSDCVVSQICVLLTAGVREVLLKKRFNHGEIIGPGSKAHKNKILLEDKINNLIYKLVILDHLMFMNYTSKDGSTNFISLDTVSVVGKKCDAKGKKILEESLKNYHSYFKLADFDKDAGIYYYEAPAVRTGFCDGKLNMVFEKYMSNLEIKKYWGWKWLSHPHNCYPVNSVYASQLVQGLIYTNHK